MAIFVMTSEIVASARAVFEWHQRPDALRQLIPPCEPVTLERAPASLGDGETAVLVMRIGPFKLRWVARHRDFIDHGDQGGEFTDEQVSGPFESWVHRHVVTANGSARCILEDRIVYELPFKRLGAFLGGWYIRRKLERMFAYRHEATQRALVAGPEP